MIHSAQAGGLEGQLRPLVEDVGWLFKRPAWQTDAACRGSDPDLFFPEEAQTKAQRQYVTDICASCPVREPCLEFGMTQDLGTWGGLTQRQRANLKGMAHVRGKSVTNVALGLPRRSVEIRPCSECGRDFEPRSTNHRYCSDRCSNAYWGRLRRRNQTREGE